MLLVSSVMFEKTASWERLSERIEGDWLIKFHFSGEIECYQEDKWKYLVREKVQFWNDTFRNIQNDITANHCRKFLILTLNQHQHWLNTVIILHKSNNSCNAMLCGCGLVHYKIRSEGERSENNKRSCGDNILFGWVAQSCEAWVCSHCRVMITHSVTIRHNTHILWSHSGHTVSFMAHKVRVVGTCQKLQLNTQNFLFHLILDARLAICSKGKPKLLIFMLASHAAFQTLPGF